MSNVKYKNIWGKSASEVAVRLECSTSVPCRHIIFDEIHLVGEEGEQTNGLCQNVMWNEIGNVYPTCASN